MHTLHIHLLGDFRLIFAGALVTTVVQSRMQSLLAYLLLHREAPQSRQRIAFLFWPDSSEEQARTNLRQLLHQLRGCLPDCNKFLRIETKTLQWRLDATYILDVADFEQNLSQAAIAAKEGHTALERTKLEAAIRGYGGTLLDGFYEEWILPERERLSQAYMEALQRLITLAEEEGDYQLAIRYEEYLLRHDRLSETNYRRLMQLYALNGDRASALRVYHTCVTALASELGIEPNIDTQEAYQQLLNLKDPSNSQSSSVSTPASRINLVGRFHEWDILHKAWQTVASGQATFVVISGEAGIGKSRLAEDFLDWAARQGAKTARTRSFAAKELPYASVIELLRTNPLLLNLSTLDVVWRKEIVRLMPELAVDHPNLLKPEPVNDPWQRLRLFEALARAVLNEHKKPVVLLFDDLQWCDQDTLEWLHYLLHFDTRARLLVLGGVRTEELARVHPLNSLLLDFHLQEQVIEIELAPLDASDTAALAEQASGRKLTAEQAEQLYRYTEGNLLFIVETLRAEMSSDRFGPESAMFRTQITDQVLPSSAKVPAKVQAVIQFRLRQLSPPARGLVRYAACIGRAFSASVLHQASGVDEETFVRGLDELWQRRIVREQGDDVYDFTHDRIRDVAYAETSPVQRRLIHRRVAAALERTYMQNLDIVSGQIAVQYEQAGKYAEAVSYYRQAAGVAMRTFSNAEVIDLINRAIALLPSLPDTPDRRRTELKMLIQLGTAQMLVRGVGQSEAAQTLLRAWDLYQLQREPGDAVTGLAGLSLCYHLQGDHKQAQKWAKRLKTEVQTTANPLFHIIVQLTLTGAALFRGVFLEAERHAKQAFAQDGPDQDLSKITALGFDPVLTILGYWSLTLWLLGYPDQARTKVKDALGLAEVFRQPVDRGYISSMNSIVHQLRGDVALTLEQASGTLDYARENGLDQWVNHGRILSGWALAQGGQVERGYEQVRQGVAAWESAGARLALTYYQLLLAETCSVSGRIEEGLRIVAETLDAVHAEGESWMQAELYRRQGELLLLQGADEQDSEACFQKALDVARLQGARSFELRATMSLSRLWQRQGRRTEARHLLGEIYAWFSEGLDTADLREAKELLEVLR